MLTILMSMTTAWAWTLGDAYHLDDPVEIDDPLFQLELARGSLFVVHGDDGAPAGWVHVGEGRLEVTPTRSRDAQVAANRLVSLLDTPIEEARAIGEGAPLTSATEGAVVLGATAWDAVSDAVRPYRIERGVVLIPSREGYDEVLVVRRVKRDRRLAERWLAERSSWLDQVGMDPGGLLVADRWEQQAGTGARGRWMASVKTDRDWGLFAGDRVQPRVPQPWLEVMVDDSGVLDLSARATVLAHGPTTVSWPVATDLFPAGVDGQPAAPTRADLHRGALIARFDPEGAGLAVILSTGAQLEVEAVGGPIAHVVLDLPHHWQQGFCTEPPLPEGFELVTLRDRATGDPLETRPVSLGRQDEDRGDIRTLAVRLPRVLEAGERTVIDLQLRDRIRQSHWCNYHPPVDMVGHGRATRLLPVMPRLRSHAGAPAPVEVTAGVVPMGRLNHVVVSHGDGERWEDNTGRWVRVQADSRGLRLGMGRWIEEQVASIPGGPLLEIHSLYGDAGSGTEAMIEQIRGQLALYGPALPPMPHARLAITENARPNPKFDGPPTLDIGNGIGAHGELQWIHTRLTNLRGARLSTLLLTQWWTPLDVRPADGYLPGALAAVYTLNGVEAVEGERESREWWNAIRGEIDRRVGWSQRSDSTSPGASLAWALGPVLLAETGDPSALYDSVAAVLTGEHPPSWDGLEQSLAARTGRDWDGFFLAWIHSGTTPALAAEAEATPEGLRVTVTSDLPYGRFGVPVRLGSGRDARWVDVRVVNGEGSAAIAWEGPLPTVTVDPERLLPLRGVENRHARVSGG